jgi:hydrogenase maturation protease
VTRPRLLIAGVGSVFRGDDGFGCEVTRRLIGRQSTGDIRVRDFGTRGHDLAYAVLDGYDAVILVDAIARGGLPGTLYVIEPTPEDFTNRETPVETHGVDLPSVFRLVRAMGGVVPPLRLVGCEPADLGPDHEGAFGLSEPVTAAIERAVELVEAVIAELCRA